MNTKKIFVIGGGFAGVKAALELDKRKLPDTKIILISDKPHFEYYPLFYRVLGGHTPLEVCIPLSSIFEDTGVEVIQDSIYRFNLKEKMFVGRSASFYSYDTLVLALGSETAYYDTPGLKELSYNVQSIHNILRLKKHLHQIFNECVRTDSNDKNCSAHIVVVGGGPTGCGIAANLALYGRSLAQRHGIDPSFITIDIIQSPSRLVPMMPEKISEKVKKHLQSLGVNIFLNRRVMKEEVAGVFMKDMQLDTKTLVWCAGVRPSSVYADIGGFDLDSKFRVLVDEHLQAKDWEDVYVIGDGASLPYSGLALTALEDADYVANYIANKQLNIHTEPYVQKARNPIVPLEPGWGVGTVKGVWIEGKMAWTVKRMMDLEFFKSILPREKAWAAYKEDKVMWETCPICAPQIQTA